LVGDLVVQVVGSGLDGSLRFGIGSDSANKNLTFLLLFHQTRILVIVYRATKGKSWVSWGSMDERRIWYVPSYRYISVDLTIVDAIKK
jgi:hypothetical protein